jgi:hypothetical protein
MNDGMIKLYLHALAGGEFDQLEYEDMVVVMFKPHPKFKCSFRRRGSGAENPMHHPMMMFNRATGSSTFVTPGTWTAFNAIDILDSLRKRGVDVSDETDESIDYQSVGHQGYLQPEHTVAVVRRVKLDT